MTTYANPPSVKRKAFPGTAPIGQGRGLFASEEIKPCDDIVHVQSPFVAVLDTERLQDTCSGCFGKRQLEAESGSEADGGVALKACTGCQVVKYCDRTCQAKDWKLAHSRECGIYKNLKPRVLPINARALLRLVSRLEAKKEPPAEEDLDLFNMNQAHTRDIHEEDNKEQLERIALTSKAVKEYSGTRITEEILSLYSAKLDVNSFNLTNALYDRVGMYFHPYAAFINHSCDYNAVMGFDGPDLYIKAVLPIAKDEQIFISYIDTTFPLSIRRKELCERYFFTCKCTKCTSEDANPEPEPTSSSPAHTVTKAAYGLLDVGFSSVSDEQITTLMQAFSSYNIPKTKQPFVSIFDALISHEITDQLWQAFFHCAVRSARIDPAVYKLENHPLRAVHAWALAKITLQMSQELPGLRFPNVMLQGTSGSSSGPADQAADFGDSIPFDYGLLAWSFLAELVGNEARYCTVPGFRTMVKRTFAEVHEEYLRHGVDPRNLRDRVQGEREKLTLAAGKYWKGILLEKD